MTFSNILSVIAVLISGLSLALAWRQYARDRSRLKLNLSLRDDVKDGPAFLLSAVNAGRRPVTVVRGVALVESGHYYPVYDTRIELKENDAFDFSVPFSGFFNSISSGDFIKAFELEDSTGRRVSIGTRSLRKQIKKIMS
jgi:hypothetical protein